VRENQALFDDLVGTSEQRRRNFEAERLRSLEVEHQLDFDRLYHWQVGRRRDMSEWSAPLGPDSLRLVI